MVDTPTAVPTDTAVSNDAFFQSKVQGSRVAYFNPSTSQVCALASDWSVKICTPSNQPVTPTDMAWSPTGDRLVIDSNNANLKIWTLGAGVRPLIDAADGESIYNPDWSPDGKTIAYASNRFLRTADELELYDVFTVSVDDPTPFYLTRARAADNHHPRFSPDGSHLAYFSATILKYPDGTTRPSTYQLTLVDLSDPSLTPVFLTSGEEYGLSPASVLAWSPDSNQIIFYGRRLYMVNMDGSGAQQVGGTDYGAVAHLTWLPGGPSALSGSKSVDLDTGDPASLTFLFDPLLARWVFPTASAALQPIPAPNCAADWTKLYPGATAAVTGEDTDPPNVVRAGPGKSNEVIFNLYPKSIVKILEGPVCADGLVYWKVENSLIPGGVGWTAEGNNAEYWLVMVAP